MISIRFLILTCFCIIYGTENSFCRQSRQIRNGTNMDCSSYHDRPVVCRKKQCVYDCAAQKCEEEPEDISVPPKDPESCTNQPGMCEEHCSDICTCHIIGTCQMSSAGHCKPLGNSACTDAHFPDHACGRIYAFYMRDGIPCRNLKHRGECDIAKTIVAYNHGGPKATDMRGVEFIPDDATKYTDTHKIRQILAATLPPSFPDAERPFFENMMFPDDSKRGPFRCIVYQIPLCIDGDYELLIKTSEMFDFVVPGEQMFNIFFGSVDEYLYKEIDVLKYAIHHHEPIDLIINFQVKDAALKIDDTTQYAILNGSVPLGFCYSECSLTESTFQIAAFSVTKFVDKHHPEENNQYCGLFDNFWDCFTTHCAFNHTTHRCSPIKEECKKLYDSTGKECIPPKQTSLFY